MFGTVRRAAAYFIARRKETRWNVYASHACFYATVSSIPLLMLLLMLIGRVMPDRVEYLLTAVKERLPEQIASYFPEEFVTNAMNAGAPMAIATVFVMLWSTAKCMRALAQGLRAVYGAKESSAFKNFFAPFLYAALLFLLVALSLAVLVFGETILGIFEAQKSSHRGLVRLIVRGGWLAAFVIFVLVFALAYKFFSGRKAKLWRHLPGALFSAGGWLLYSWLFSLYLKLVRPERYLVYGSLGAVLILLLWGHACMTFLMLGGEVNVLFLNRPALIKSKKAVSDGEK